MLSDYKTLAKLARVTFVDAFEKENNPDNFKNYMETAFNNRSIKDQLNNANSIFYFIYSQNALVGYIKLNENEAQNEQFDNTSIELERIYILQKFQGKQLGEKSLLKIIEMTKSKKVDFLWLGVWEHNLSAIRFYKRYGFKKFGEHPYMLGSDKQTDWLMKIEFS